MKNMTWKFVASDRVPLDHLLEARVFYINDLLSARKEVAKHLELQKYGLPNWRIGMIRRQMGVDESRKNLDSVEEAINLARKRGD